MRQPPDPEKVRRCIERKRAGESVASIARDAGVTPSTVARWIRAAGGAEPAPPIMLAPPPAPPDSPGELAGDLVRVAEALDAADGGDLAAIVRRAIDALRALATAGTADDPGMPDPGVDTRGWIVAMMRRAQRSYDVAEATHNAMASKQFVATLERLARLLKQVDAASSGGELITIPRAELAERKARVIDTLRALTTDTPRCADCNRAIRVSWAATETNEPKGR